MNMLTRISHLIVFLLSFALTSAFSQSALQHAGQTEQKTGIGQASSVISTSSLNINNLWLRIQNDGRIGFDSISHRGLTYPFQHGNLLYCDNLIWVGKVYDGRVPESSMQLPELRTGGGIWQTGVRPGSIISKGVAEDLNSDAARVSRYRPDYLTADLTYDVAASSGIEIQAVTSAMVAATRIGYAKDLAEWPWQKGAPFVDQNRNGKMDAGEKPGIQGAGQIAWFSYNDLDEARAKSFAGGPSIGLEVQVTLWAYQGTPNLDDVIFKRYRVIYKGTTSALSTSRIDSMYFTQWADLIIGDYLNDLGGCDSTLSLGYQFNSIEPDPIYRNLGGANPALGYALLQGPLVQGASGDNGIFGFESLRGKKNLAMTSFLLNPSGDPISEPSYNTRSFWYWNVARGFSPYGHYSINETPWKEPNGRTTKFMYSGDPITKTGWIDGLGKMWGNGISAVPGEKRFMLSSGPFSMALGDTQEVVIAMIASAAPTGVENVTWLRNRTKFVHGIYENLGNYVSGFVTSVDNRPDIPVEFALDQNYPNPFNPSTHIRFTIPREGQAKLSVFDLLGQEIRVVHQGLLSAGEHTLSWDGRDALGDPAPSGVYFYKLTHGDRQVTRKLLLVR